MGEDGDAFSTSLSGFFRGRCPAWPRGLNLLEPRLVESHTAVIIPSDDRVIFVSLFNCAESSSRLSEVAQTLHAISGIQFLVGDRGLGERWLLGTIGVRSGPGARQGGLGGCGE